MLFTYDEASCDQLLANEEPQNIRDDIIERMRSYFEEMTVEMPAAPASGNSRGQHYQRFKDFLIDALIINRKDVMKLASLIKKDESEWRNKKSIKKISTIESGGPVAKHDTVIVYDEVQVQFDELVASHNTFITKITDALQNSGRFKNSPVTSQAFAQDLEVLFSRKNKIVQFITEAIENDGLNAYNAHSFPSTMVFASMMFQDSTSNDQQPNKTARFEKFRIVLELSEKTAVFLMTNIKELVEYCKQNINDIKKKKLGKIISEFEACKITSFASM